MQIFIPAIRQDILDFGERELVTFGKGMGAIIIPAYGDRMKLKETMKADVRLLGEEIAEYSMSSFVLLRTAGQPECCPQKKSDMSSDPFLQIHEPSHHWS